MVVVECQSTTQKNQGMNRILRHSHAARTLSQGSILELNQRFDLGEDKKLRRCLYSRSVTKTHLRRLVRLARGSEEIGVKDSSKADLVEQLLEARRHPAWRSAQRFAEQADGGAVGAVAVGLNWQVAIHTLTNM